LVKEDDGEANVTLLQAYWISLPHDITLWTRTVFTQVHFWLRVSFCLRWMAKSRNVSASNFSSNMVIIPHPPYSLDLAPWFRFVSHIQNKTEKCLTSKGNHKQYSTALGKMPSTVLSKHRKNARITAYVPKETILKELTAKIK
jgi:hypothetical protein